MFEQFSMFVAGASQDSESALFRYRPSPAERAGNTRG